jgi:hypothetical protein
MRGRALLLATSRYADSKLSELRSTAVDVAGLRGVLADPQVGDFGVEECVEATAQTWRERVEEFFGDAARDEMLLLYISGHGVKDRDGRLYFATADTKLNRLMSTGVAATFIQDVSARSRSRRQLMLFDTCFSGAFAKGYQFKAGGNAVGAGQLFGEGGGKIVITASDEMQYALEEDDIKGAPVPSVFTRHLVEGLASGLADVDGDGAVSVKDLFDYISDSMRRETPQQRPQQWAFGLTGDLVLAANPKPRAGKLPHHLTERLEHPHASVRKTGLDELVSLLESGNAPLALAARAALERLTNDDSRQISTAAKEVLGARFRPLPAAQPSESLKSARPSESPLPELDWVKVRPEPTASAPQARGQSQPIGWRKRWLLRWLGGAAGAALTLWAIWNVAFLGDGVLASVALLNYVVVFAAAYGTYGTISLRDNFAVQSAILAVPLVAIGVLGQVLSDLWSDMLFEGERELAVAALILLTVALVRRMLGRRQEQP